MNLTNIERKHRKHKNEEIRKLKADNFTRLDYLNKVKKIAILATYNKTKQKDKAFSLPKDGHMFSDEWSLMSKQQKKEYYRDGTYYGKEKIYRILGK